MATEIKTWQIKDGKLQAISSTLAAASRTEPYDLEPWLESEPSILGPDVAIIGRQVASRSGFIDLLGIDTLGNTVIIELKRDKLPREALVQAIDYASDVAEWQIDKLSEVASKYSSKGIDEVLSEAFGETEIESLSINDDQRIILVGFAVEASLERMIAWLSTGFGVNINAVVLNYIQTSSGDELLTRTSVISEELEQERAKKKRKFEIPMSDEAGNHDPVKLRSLLLEYLSRPKVTSQRIRDVLMPALLEHQMLSRQELKTKLIHYDPALDESRIGYYLTTISCQLGMAKNDFLRQVVSYDYPKFDWEKDNFRLREPYREVVQEVLAELASGDPGPTVSGQAL